MQTMRLGKLDFDEAELVAELEVSERFEYMEPYSEFLCGRPWKSCMLWAPGGDAGDGVIAHYDASRPSALTPYGRRMPHLAGLLEAHFSLDHLNFARLAVMTDSLLIPHRDYVEFDPAADPRTVAHRLHVALRTSADCMFLEGDVVFRMKAGEVWFLDVREVHSAAVLSDLRRVHLILDFTDAESMGDLVEFHPEYEGIPQDSVCDRPPLGEEESEHLLALAGVLDMDNYRDVFGILIKKQYRRDGGKDFFWRTVEEIAGRTTDATVAEHVRGLARYYLMERAE